MPLFIDPKDLKAAARLTSKIKKINEDAGKKYRWCTVHRLVCTGSSLILHTTDGATFLELPIPAKGCVNEDFDILVDAPQFNSLASRSMETGLYEVSRSEDILTLSQTCQTLRLGELMLGSYPTPPRVVTNDVPPTGQEVRWRTDSRPLAEALAYIIPYINPKAATSEKSVATILTSGTLITGTPRQVAFVSGLDAPTTPISFKKHVAEAVMSFLQEGDGKVEFEVHGGLYTLTLAGGHKLVVPAEESSFRNLICKLESGSHERLLVDLKHLLRSVSVLEAVLPVGANRLNLEFRGAGENAAVTITTSGDERLKSSDTFQIIRDFVDESGIVSPNPPPTTQISLNGTHLREILAKLDEVTLCVRYEEHRGILRIQGHQPTDSVKPLRSVVLHIPKMKDRNPESPANAQRPSVEIRPEADTALKEETTPLPSNLPGTSSPEINGLLTPLGG